MQPIYTEIGPDEALRFSILEFPSYPLHCCNMGSSISLFQESFPPASKFSTDDIPDLTGKVIIVTGANAGVGKETAQALLAKNAKVYMAGRNTAKLAEAIKQVKATTGKEGIPLQVDLADLPSIKRGVDEFLSKESQLHVLFNNAGVFNPPIGDVTAQGYDLQFGTNVLGHFYLTKLLLPVLLSTAKATGIKSRVVHTSSIRSRNVSKLDFNTFKDGPTRRKWSPWTLYSQSKLGNVIVANEFAKRYGDQDLISCSCNPGNLKTELQRHTAPLATFFINMILYPAPMGALTQLWAGTSDEGLNMNGKYLIPWARYGNANPVAQDPKLGEDLWKWLEEQVADL
ncbi:hypothetical protein BKA70DRAFT_1266949 [Coprinopsis sp. MPI-PUGE-AT-0042]|nr:hypothetical protein BKA70DRAFT_1266949 [Coprinopsis sp. MPI-PUGE-AT-0042]